MFSKNIFFLLVAIVSAYSVDKPAIKSIETSEYLVKWITGESAKLRMLIHTTKQFDLNGKDSSGNNCRAEDICQSYNNIYENGQLAESHKYNYKGERISRTIYKYDPNGRKSEQVIINEPSGLTYRIAFKYDGKGNLVEENHYQPDGSIRMIFLHQYDKKGHLVWENSDSKDSVSYAYKYDKKGNRIERDLLDRNHKIKLKEVYSNGDPRNGWNVYDSNNRIIEEHKRFEKFVYDKAGNWTIDSIFENDTLIHLSNRVITYY